MKRSPRRPSPELEYTDQELDLAIERERIHLLAHPHANRADHIQLIQERRLRRLATGVNPGADVRNRENDSSLISILDRQIEDFTHLKELARNDDNARNTGYFSRVLRALLHARAQL